MAFVVSRNYEILTNPSEEKDPLKIIEALPVNLIRRQQQIQQPIYRENNEKFPHDEDRENWKSQRDFWMACIGCSFGIPTMFYVPYLAVITTGGAPFLVMYAIALFFVCTPVIFLQMTVGQYSRTGFVSFFRFSPLWKGIGYVMLIFNLSKCLLHDYLASLQIFYMVDKQIAA